MKKYLFILGLLALPIAVSAGTLYDYFNKDIPSISYRGTLAEIYGVVDHESDYTGSYEQNVKLLRALSMETPLNAPEDELGSFAPTTGFEERLTETISKTDTTIPLSATTDRDGISIGCSATNKCYFTLEPGTTREETTVCSGLSSLSVTSCVRGLPATGSEETASTTLAFVHNAGSKIIMTNVSQFFGNFMDLWTSQTASGTKSFLQYPEVPTAVGNATTTRQLLTLGQAQGLSNQGAATSTTAVAGISELATQVEMASSTAWGVDEPHVIQSQYATSTPSGTSYSGLFVPITQNNGKLHQLWLDLTEVWSFTGLISVVDITSTGTTTVSDLVVNGAIEGVAGPATSTTYTTAGADTWTKPTGAKKVFVQLWAGGGSGGAEDIGGGETVGGGGGGGYSEKWFDADDLGATETLAIGAGGAAVSSANNGNAGGNSTFGTSATLVTAYGGGYGAIATGGGGGGGPMGAGGNGSASDGTAGKPGAPIAGVGDGSDGLYGAGGGNEISREGGDAYYGGAGGAGLSSLTFSSGGTSIHGGDGGNSAETTPEAGTQPGGGGGAGHTVSGKGGDGQIIVTVFF